MCVCRINNDMAAHSVTPATGRPVRAKLQARRDAFANTAGLRFISLCYFFIFIFWPVRFDRACSRKPRSEREEGLLNLKPLTEWLKAEGIMVPPSCTCLLPRLCSTNGIIGDGRQGFTVPPDVPGRWRFLGPTTKLLAAAEENTVIIK